MYTVYILSQLLFSDSINANGGCSKLNECALGLSLFLLTHTKQKISMFVVQRHSIFTLFLHHRPLSFKIMLKAAQGLFQNYLLLTKLVEAFPYLSH